MSKNGMTRRTFIFGTAIMAAGCATARPKIRKVSANEKLNIASVGVGGKGYGEVNGCYNKGENNIVGLCDVDWKRASKTFADYPSAPRFRDFRKMFDKMHKDIDAVTISTPDHMHAPVAVAAMQLGKHVYVQKPLTHNIYEARRLTELAKQYGVATQMGNQGHSGEGVRRLTEWIASGVIGDVTEAHIWTDRPLWKQGMNRPGGADPIPADLDWNLWLGVAPKRPYKGLRPDAKPDDNHGNYYCPWTWRGWWDFGCGALGDMACHIMDPAYTALKLKYPTTVEARNVEGLTSEQCPNKSVIEYQFAARENMPPVKVVWYDGGNLPPRPADIPKDEKLGDGDNGTLFIGTKGYMSCGCYGDTVSLNPQSKMKDFKKPPRTIPSSAGHYAEWLNACKGIEVEAGNWRGRFEYAGPFTEMVHLGSLAIRVGQKIEYDAVNGRVTNVPEANKYIKREYRNGYKDLA